MSIAHGCVFVVGYKIRYEEILNTSYKFVCVRDGIGGGTYAAEGAQIPALNCNCTHESREKMDCGPGISHRDHVQKLGSLFF